MTAQIIKDFNTMLECLIQQIAPFTKNSYHILFKNLVRANATIPIKTFNEYAIPLKNKIKQHDESFFINEDFSSQVSTQDIMNNDDVIQEIFNLRNVWAQLDEDSKENLWQMVEGLLQLGETYYYK